MPSLEYKTLEQNTFGQMPYLVQQDITNNFKPHKAFLDCEKPNHTTLGWSVQ